MKARSHRNIQVLGIVLSKLYGRSFCNFLRMYLRNLSRDLLLVLVILTAVSSTLAKVSLGVEVWGNLLSLASTSFVASLWKSIERDIRRLEALLSDQQDKFLHKMKTRVSLLLLLGFESLLFCLDFPILSLLLGLLVYVLIELVEYLYKRWIGERRAAARRRFLSQFKPRDSYLAIFVRMHVKEMTEPDFVLTWTLYALSVILVMVCLGLEMTEHKFMWLSLILSVSIFPINYLARDLEAFSFYDQQTKSWKASYIFAHIIIQICLSSPMLLGAVWISRQYPKTAMLVPVLLGCGLILLNGFVHYLRCEIPNRKWYRMLLGTLCSLFPIFILLTIPWFVRRFRFNVIWEKSDARS